MSPPLDLSAASDQAVVAWARQGREEAFQELVRRYAGPVFARIYQIVGNRERAEDLTQETFDKVFRALDSYNPARRFAPWIKRICRNAAVDYVRVKRPDSPIWPSAVTLGEIHARPVHVTDSGDFPTPTTDPREDAAALEQAIGRLRPEYRRCVILRFVEERSYESIARIMKLPVGTVSTYLSRAKKELKTMLGPSPDSWPSDPAHSLI